MADVKETVVELTRAEKIRKRLGKTLKSLRKTKKMTQVETAGGLGMNYRHYQDIEAGKSDLKVSSLVKIAGFFGTPLGQLMDANTVSGSELVENMKQFLASFGNSLMVPLTLRDMDGLVVTANRASLALGGFDLSDVVGKHVTDFVTENARPYYLDVIAEEQKGNFNPVVFNFLDKSGAAQSVNYYPIPIVGMDGKPEAVLAFLCPQEFELKGANQQAGPKLLPPLG